MIISDYHVHTYLCRHAHGEPIEYLKVASERGLKILGFSDHCPVPVGFDSESRMYLSNFEEYLTIINDLRDNPYGIEILLGMEVDWVPNRMDEVYEFLGTFGYDYLIGSVHHADTEYPFDHPKYMEQWDTEEKKQSIWDVYIDRVYEMISSEKFDIIGHIDLPKKFGLYPKNLKYFNQKMEECLEAAGQLGVAIELNTAGLRKPVKEIYPSMDFLKIARRHNVNVTFGADAHKPEEVAYNFDEARKWAKQAEYTEYLCITKAGKKTVKL